MSTTNKYSVRRALINSILSLCTGGLWTVWSEYRNHKIFG